MTKITCPLARRNAGSASRTSSAAEATFTAIVRRQVSGPDSATASTGEIPAQCTTARTSVSSPTAAARDKGSARSASIPGTASRPTPRPTAITRCPAASRALTSAVPIPPVAPVSSTFPMRAPLSPRRE
ncbi:hypothetical protein GCM10010176_006710 [Nonomuraea spiralis]|nr:hypothetical protein GCM10010176_006710 [Nonomuraea spiralis]